MVKYIIKYKGFSPVAYYNKSSLKECMLFDNMKVNYSKIEWFERYENKEYCYY